MIPTPTDFRASVLMARHENKDNETVTEVCDMFLRMFPAESKVIWLERSQPKDE